MSDTPDTSLGALPQNFQPLLDELRGKTDAQRDAIRKETDAKIEAIKDEAKAEKLKALEAGQAELEDLAKTIRQKALEQVRREKRDRIRREVGLAVDNILEKCHAHAATLLDDPSFTARLGQFLQEAVCCAETYRNRLGGHEVTIETHPKLANACRKLVEERNLDATVTESETAGTGVVALLSGTPYRIINTVESRLLKHDEKLRSLVSKRLTETLEERQSE